jgi:hypothetical protein
MEIVMIARITLILFVVLASVIAALAQEGSIVQSADPVKLRLFWAQEGQEHGDWFGSSFSAIPDVNGDGTSEILIATFRPRELRLYLGGPVSPRLHPTWRFDSGHAWAAKATGRFFGDGRLHVPIVAPDRLLHFMAIDSDLAQTATRVWPATSGALRGYLEDIAAADFDGDGSDELLCFLLFVDGDPNRLWSRVWLYKGGVGIDLETPTTVLIDSGWTNSGSYMRGAAGDLDGDGHPDIITTQDYSGRGTVMNIWFGDGQVPTARRPDRSLEVPISTWHLVDADGDGVKDLMDDQRLYLSSKGKSARTRSFSDTDVDFVISDIHYFSYPFGPMNNTPGRYSMLGPSAFDQAFGPKMIVYSGGPNGPDHGADAVFFPHDHGFLSDVDRRGSGPAGDINGDGWSDFIFGNPRYYDPGVDKGIVGILAGGPYIPVDDPSMGVRHVVTGEHPRALSIWPNPVRDRLNIAWRGDLTHRPARFEIVDARGAILADGTVDPSVGLATWNSAAVPPGLYVVRVYGERGVPLATTTFVKE